MITNLIAYLRRLGRQRIMRKRTLKLIATLKQRRFEMELDLAKMEHWPPGVQEHLREQIDVLSKRIKLLEN